MNRSMTDWLNHERPPETIPMCDFKRLSYEIRPGDVILVEGRSRVSEVIKLITQSSWTHSALYIGRLYDIDDADLRNIIKEHYHGDPNEQLLIEAQLGQGIIITPITFYKKDHLRICRPKGLSPTDAHNISKYCVERLGMGYDVRQILDLARFLFPWSLMPRRWRSSLFNKNVGETTKTVCSTLLADAFSHVNFPILPFMDRNENGDIKLYKRNTRLFTPKDFDYSPYFDIIKYPYMGIDEMSTYRNLPWSKKDIEYHDDIKQWRKRMEEYNKQEQEEVPEESPKTMLERSKKFLKEHTPILNKRT